MIAPKTIATPAEAFDVASMYGSYIRTGDPGACFYAFHAGDGRPVSETHRQECISYATITAAAAVELENWDNVSELLSLIAWFERAEVRP